MVGWVMVNISMFSASSPSHTSISASNSKKLDMSALVNTRYSSAQWWVWGTSMGRGLLTAVQSMYTWAFSIIVVPRKKPRGATKPYQE